MSLNYPKRDKYDYTQWIFDRSPVEQPRGYMTGCRQNNRLAICPVMRWPQSLAKMHISILKWTVLSHGQHACTRIHGHRFESCSNKAFYLQIFDNVHEISPLTCNTCNQSMEQTNKNYNIGLKLEDNINSSQQLKQAQLNEELYYTHGIIYPKHTIHKLLYTIYYKAETIMPLQYVMNSTNQSINQSIDL